MKRSAARTSAVRRRTLAAAGLAVAVLVAGCATTIAGSPVPDPGGLSAITGGGASSSGLPSSTGAAQPSGGPSSGGPGTEPTGPSAGAPSTDSSTGGPTAGPTAGPTGVPTASSTGGPTGSSTDSSTDAEDTSVGPSPTSSSGSGSQTYPTAPLTFPDNPPTQDSARLLEARRIAASLVVPTFVDSAYGKIGAISTLPMRGPAAMAVLFPAPVPTVAARAGMISGFSSSRTDGAQNGLLTAAFEFGTAAQATAAAPALAAAAADKSSDNGRAVVPGFPASTGWYGAFDDGSRYYQSFLAQGRMVLYVYLSGKKLSTTAQQAALAARTLKAASAGMASFVPTPVAGVTSLAVDRDGMRAHTLPDTVDPHVQDGLYTAAAQLHFDSDPVGTRAVFARAGVDLVSDGRTSVYRAKDAAGAAAVRDDFIAFVRKGGTMTTYTTSVGVAGAQCLQQALNSNYYCVATRGRYAFEVGADSEADLAAATKAQFDLLGQF